MADGFGLELLRGPTQAAEPLRPPPRVRRAQVPAVEMPELVHEAGVPGRPVMARTELEDVADREAHEFRFRLGLDVKLNGATRLLLLDATASK